MSFARPLSAEPCFCPVCGDYATFLRGAGHADAAQQGKVTHYPHAYVALGGACGHEWVLYFTREERSGRVAQHVQQITPEVTA